MIAGFFGHAALVNSDEIKNSLSSLMEKVIGHREVDFWVGTHGAFDAVAFCVVREFKKALRNSGGLFYYFSYFFFLINFLPLTLPPSTSTSTPAR